MTIISNPIWKIELRAYEIFDTPLTSPVVHYELVFSGPKDPRMEFYESIMAINGVAFDKDSLKPARSISFLSDNNLLKASHNTKPSFLNGKPPINTWTVWEGEKAEEAEFHEKRLRAQEISGVMNLSNIDYIVDGQNSNAAIFTIMQALGLELPKEAENVWAPGFGKSLRPHDFKSYYDTYPITKENLPEFVFIKDVSAFYGPHHAYADRVYDLGLKDGVGIHNLIDDMDPFMEPDKGSIPKFQKNFDPDQPFEDDLLGPDAFAFFQEQYGDGKTIEKPTSVLGMVGINVF